MRSGSEQRRQGTGLNPVPFERRRFVLVESLSGGGPALARLMRFNRESETYQVTDYEFSVYAFLNGIEGEPSEDVENAPEDGDQGLCEYWPDSGRFEVYQMTPECP